MTESIADGLSVAGLVIGFPLLLLAFMVSLEKLESWGLRETEPGQGARPELQDRVDAAVDAVEQLSVVAAERDHEATGASPARR